MIKVLFVANQMSFNLYGGAETQMIKTFEYINKLSDGKYSIKLFDMWHDDIEECDIVHVFKPTSFSFESLAISKYAKKNGIKVVSSSIFYYDENQNEQKDIVLIILSKLLIRFRKRFMKFWPFFYFDPFRHAEAVFNLSDVILPNTKEELRILSSFLNIDTSKCLIVPNGVNSEFKYGNQSLFREKYHLNDFILFVGRIERRKNVLQLIRAFVKSELNTHLVIIGKISDPAYYSICKKESNQKVIFLPPIPHDSDLLKSAYKSAKVVALPSKYETPGLVALEGGLAGANVVVTSVGGTKEYFKEYAWYINPKSEESIRKALIDAYNSPCSGLLSEHIKKNFGWNTVAKKTMEAYDIVMRS